MIVRTGSTLRALMWSLSVGLFVSLGGITLTSCASGDKDKGGDDVASDDGEKKTKKKKKKKKKKTTDDSKPAGDGAN